jgi:imidazolonepropionase-like amidohydrolase
MTSSTILANARLIKGDGSDPQDNVFIHVEGSRILKVSRQPISHAGATMIDGSGMTVMPALIDTHTHISAGDYLNKVHLLPKAVNAARGFRALSECLDYGITTIRDAGFTDYGFKQAVQEGSAEGPRMRLAIAPLSQTGGHSDFRTREEDDYRQADGIYHPGLVADGPDGCRRAAREVLRRGADQIKIMASGGCTSPTDSVDHCQFTDEEMNAIVYEARAQDKYVMAHAYTPQSILACVAAGIRSIEHGNGVDEEAADAMKESGVFAVPTIATYELLLRDGLAGGMPEDQVTMVKKVLGTAYEALEILKDRGVKIASGSDVLGPHQGYKTYELELKARVLGPLATITAATLTNAELIGMSQDLGTIEEGKLADLIVLSRDPLADITSLQDKSTFQLVMSEGRILRDNRGA